MKNIFVNINLFFSLDCGFLNVNIIVAKINKQHNIQYITLEYANDKSIPEVCCE